MHLWRTKRTSYGYERKDDQWLLGKYFSISSVEIRERRIYHESVDTISQSGGAIFRPIEHATKENRRRLFSRSFFDEGL